MFSRRNRWLRHFQAPLLDIFRNVWYPDPTKRRKESGL